MTRSYTIAQFCFFARVAKVSAEGGINSGAAKKQVSADRHPTGVFANMG